MNQEMEELMLDLLCKKAIYGLTTGEETQLADLQRAAGNLGDAESIELTVAALSLAGLDYGEAVMPKNLQARVAAEAERFFDERESRPAASEPSVAAETLRPVGSWLFGWLGWAAAAAACVALAVNIYMTRPGFEVAKVPQTPAAQQPERLTPAQMRERLIASADDLARGSFGPGNVKSVVPSGDVVWSDAKQAGYMRFTNLPKNDPSKETYQLWIFDETQDEKTPIDGGTFDVTSDGEVVVPINAKLNPHNTKAFAITVEKPGGVVVSKREKIIALAKREV
jgi:anti-sigma-K factor RskA